VRHTRKKLHLRESHGLELDGEREEKPLFRVGRVGCVDFHQLGAKVPEVIREDYWIVGRGLARGVAIRGYVNIYARQHPGERWRWRRALHLRGMTIGGIFCRGKVGKSEISAIVRFGCQ